jgi:hypothetical protein
MIMPIVHYLHKVACMYMRTYMHLHVYTLSLSLSLSLSSMKLEGRNMIKFC